MISVTCHDGRKCVSSCGSGPCSRRCQVCQRMAWADDGPPCPACPDAGQCRLCHGTGVIMSPDCDCGAAAASGWGGPCDPHCGTERCPNLCPIAESRDEAIAVWRRFWPARGIPMTAVYRQLDLEGRLTAELAGFAPEDAGFDVDAGLERLLARMLADDPAGTERRMQRLRATMARMDEDPAERERIERIAREAGIPGAGEQQ